MSELNFSFSQIIIKYKKVCIQILIIKNNKSKKKFNTHRFHRIMLILFDSF